RDSGSFVLVMRFLPGVASKARGFFRGILICLPGHLYTPVLREQQALRGLSSNHVIVREDKPATAKYCSIVERHLSAASGLPTV
ncbi:MAG: hypothetical protein RLO48_08195, partial [Bauldia litoralis]